MACVGVWMPRSVDGGALCAGGRARHRKVNAHLWLGISTQGLDQALIEEAARCARHEGNVMYETLKLATDDSRAPP